MTEFPAATIIVPTYNAQQYLGITLEHLLAQRNVRVEINVVDDCSTDDTRRVAMEYVVRDPRVVYSSTKVNCGGPAGPRNLGVESAQTDWVAFCDADDLWHPDKLSHQFRCALATGAALVCTRIETFRDSAGTSMMSASIGQNPPISRINMLQMLLKNRVATSSVLCRRALISRVGGFNTDRSMIAVEDYDLWLRLMAKLNAKVVRIDLPLVAYRRLPGSLSAQKWLQAAKIMRVHRRVFAAKGWLPLFPLAAPVMICCYVLSWLFLRWRDSRPVKMTLTA
jgi:teichuronic acid biosynthesis glycosyltransferase TuaG